MPASTLMPFQHVQVVAAIGLGNVAIGVARSHWPRAGLASLRGVIVRVHAELGHEPAADVVVVEVAADAQLLDLHLVGAAGLAGAVESVVLGMVEVVDVVRVDTELAGEVLACRATDCVCGCCR